MFGFFCLFFWGVKMWNCIKQFVVLSCSICFLSQITFRRDLFLFGFKKHFNTQTPADNFCTKRPNHCTMVLHLYENLSWCCRFLWNHSASQWGSTSDAFRETGKFNISGTCFSNCIFAPFRLAEANAQGDLGADTSAVYSCCLSVPSTSSVYLVLPDALILPAATKGPLSREKVLTPFSVKAQH